MSEFRKCTVCGKFDFIESHKCPPKWEVCVEDIGGWGTLYAIDSGGAAILCAEKQDDEYELMNGGDFNVCVRKHGEDEIERFTCTGEAIPTYYAELLKGSDNGANPSTE